MKRKKSLFGQRMALGAVIVLVAFYALYHLGALFGTEMKTYAATVTAETRVVGGTGYLFRDETVLRSSYEGVADYHVKDGVKVSEGQTLAFVYERGGDEEQALLKLLDGQISLLESSLSTGVTVPDPIELREELRAEYLLLMKMLAEQSSVGLSDRTDSFLSGLNRVDTLVNGKDSKSYETLSALRAQRREILSDAGAVSEAQKAARSGYFYSTVDGCESLFTMNAASEEMLSEESFYSLLSSMETATADKSAYGKLCMSSEWRLVLPLSPEEAESFAIGQTYTGVFGNGEAEIPLTLENKKDAPDHGQILLVFSADRMPSGFSFDRTQSVRMTVERSEGLYVPKSVVIRRDGRYGVYILRGSVVRFRYVELLYEGSDFYLVRSDLTRDDEGRVYLQVNDLIILNGKNLFDGRVMN